MIEARLRHQYAHAPMPGPKTELPLAIPPSAPALMGTKVKGKSRAISS